MHTKYRSKTPEEDDDLKDQGVDEKIKLRGIVEKLSGKLCIDFTWLRMGTSGGLLWTWWWTFEFHKREWIFFISRVTGRFSARILLLELMITHLTHLFIRPVMRYPPVFDCDSLQHCKRYWNTALSEARRVTWWLHEARFSFFARALQCGFNWIVFVFRYSELWRRLYTAETCEWKYCSHL